MHKEIQDLLESDRRRVALEVYRGGGKTTLLRAFTAKRIAYGISRTVLFVSESAGHSVSSIDWLADKIEERGLFAQLFGLSKGHVWRITEGHLEIQHAVLGHVATVLGRGITGQTRGINIKDYRPDLIVIDDPCDEENSATPEQRHKIKTLVFGALDKALAPASENPRAKIVILQTSLDKDDIINLCHRDPQWTTKRFPILNDEGHSVWPEREPTAEVLADKAAHIARGQTALWMREKECRAVAEETCYFKEDWLRYWDVVPTTGMVTAMGIDPAPEPSEDAIAKGLPRKNAEVFAIVGFWRDAYYVLEVRGSKNPNPEWSATQFFELAAKWRPMRIRVEGVNYQRTLKWILEKKMTERREWYPIEIAKDDKRKKYHRIRQAYSGIASQGRLLAHHSQTEFIAQFAAYPNVTYDDYLDGVSIGLDALTGVDIPVENDEEFALPPALAAGHEPLGNWRSAP